MNLSKTITHTHVNLCRTNRLIFMIEWHLYIGSLEIITKKKGGELYQIESSNVFKIYVEQLFQ